jgi:hypothetical protein
VQWLLEHHSWWRTKEPLYVVVQTPPSATKGSQAPPIAPERPVEQNVPVAQAPAEVRVQPVTESGVVQADWDGMEPAATQLPASQSMLEQDDL